MPTAVVTGGSRGIGKAILERFSREGYRVAVCATQAKSLDAVKADLKQICDVTVQKAIERFKDAIKREFGAVDVLVNNAGLAGTNSLEAGEGDALWHQIINVNLNGVYYVTKAFLPLIPEGGSIINIASILSLKGVGDATAYCAAKHGALGFTRALSEHLRPRKITVNAICPDWVRTDMALGRMQELGWSEEELLKNAPLKRFIEPEEIAGRAFYYASSSKTGEAFTFEK